MKEKKKKTVKKKKKKRGHKYDQDDSDEDIPVLHTVSTVVDAPDGVPLSDADDNDDGKANDPHKQLDINLDEPLRDDEILPVRKHREVPFEMTEENSHEERPKRRHHKKHHEKEHHEKDKKKKKDKEADKKKDKKKHKHTKKTVHVEEDDDLMKGTGDVIENSHPSPEHVTMPPEDKKSTNDLDFWLSDNSTPTKVAQPVTSPDTSPSKNALTESDGDAVKAGDGVDGKNKKKKKEKPEKKDKRKKTKRKNKSEYEEAEGITTPSKELVPPSNPTSVAPTPLTPHLPPMSNYRLLDENENIRLTYESRVNMQNSKQVIISVVFSNLTDYQIKEIEFNVLDSLNIKMERGIGASSHDPIRVPFILLPKSQNEGQFAFSVDHINVAQKLKGTLTYFIKFDDGSSHEKLDFKITLPCSSFMMGVPCKGSTYTELLESGSLNEKSSAKFVPSDTDFNYVLNKLCFYGHFSIVEQVSNDVSLYAKSIQQHHVCLLVKKTETHLSIDGKSNDLSLVSNLVDEIKTLLTQ